LAAVNFVVVRTLLDTGSEDQLTTLRDVRRNAIDSGIDRLLDRVAVMGADPGVARALIALDDGYEASASELTPAQIEQLEATYAPVVQVYDDAGVERPPVADLLPASDAGRSVQLAYIADNPYPPEERSELADAGDGSSYSAAHAQYHGFLHDLAETIGANDLLLVSAGSTEVVYSVEKRIDLGTDVQTGPYEDTSLGAAARELERSSVSDSVIVDAAFYLPDASVPLLHVAATVRDQTEVVGAIVIEISIENLTAIVTADGQFDLLGLGDTGDAYVVGADGRFRSVPRAWTEDPEGYVERYLDVGGDERTASLMEFTGGPVLLQEVDNDPVQTAAEGDDYLGIARNALDRRARIAAGPVEIAGLDWIVVTEQQTSETRGELEGFLWSTLILLAILLPILAIVGAALARVFARPVRPLLRSARAIADGDFDTEVPELGRNELGDLGRQLENIAERLREQDRSAADEEARINEMLASVLPAALVERVRRGERDITELVDTATVIAVTIAGIPEPSGAEQDEVLDLTQRLSDDMDALAAQHDVERIRAASDHQLFVAGRNEEAAFAPAALAFALDAVGCVRAVGADFGIVLSVQAGLATGLVVSGVLGTRQISFGMWGEPVDRAIALSDRGGAGVLVDGSVVDLLDDADAVTAVDEEVAGDSATYRAEDTVGAEREPER